MRPIFVSSENLDYRNELTGTILFALADPDRVSLEGSLQHSCGRTTWKKPEAGIMKLPPCAALALFAAPALMLMPLKIVAIWLIGHGRAVLGLLMIGIAKTLATAVVARLLTLTRPRLLELSWLVPVHKRWNQ